MKNSSLNRLLLLIIAAGLFSCKTSKIARRAPDGPAPVKSSEAVVKPAAIQTLESSAFDFKTLSIKAKADFSLNNNRNDVNMNIRMRKDEAIWVSLTAIAGLEVARALITPDSIKVINRLQGEYLKKPFSFIHQFTNGQLSFGALQALLIGNALPGTVSESGEFASTTEGLQVTGSLNDIVYRVLFNKENRVSSNHLKNEQAGQTLAARYRDFQDLSGRLLPMNLQIESRTGNKNVFIDLKYSMVSGNEAVDFPFSVPKRFTVID